MNRRDPWYIDPLFLLPGAIIGAGLAGAAVIIAIQQLSAWLAT